MKQFPSNKPAIISDNKMAMEIIQAHGLLDRFPQKQSLASKDAFRTVVFLPYKNHPTHWVLAGYFHNFEQAEDNGYAVFLWPKKKFPESVLVDTLRHYETGTGAVKVLDTDI